MIVDIFYSAGYVIDWYAFCDSALRLNWKRETIVKRIEYAFEEIKFNDSEIVLYKIKKYLFGDL